ncbi:MAG: hypothetical protein IJW45_05575 [Oscillospiraceae bacterium]|nr:hypothetical protein [Oscillospiraceae bacterium]
MKIAYEKPMVAVERYELSQTISACITKIGLMDSACVLVDPDAPREMKSLAVGQWFTGACKNYMSGGQSSDGVCYHTNANATFNS